MLFNSFAFLAFLPITLLIAHQLRGRSRTYFLLAASYFFYAWWEAAYLLLILFTTASTFYCANGIAASERISRKKLFLWVAISINLAILGVFKYFNFFARSFAEMATLVDFTADPFLLNVLLPVGISFYTFQCIGYVVDVYRDKTINEPSLANYALYASFFPQLVAGPIERARRLLPQLKRPAPVTYDAALNALLLIAWGFFLKLVIADRAAPYVNEIFGNYGAYSGGHYLIATALFSWQIFCDFAGYTYIAIGCAGLLGIQLMQNFRRPYLATSIRDFWSRWHISLSTWFRDYLYIPLGGNRVAPLLRYRNLLLVFLLSGLWHGAAWTFLAWGALHGVGIVIETWLRPHAARFRPASGGWRLASGILQRLLLLAFVGLTWIFFRAGSVEQAWYMITHLGDGIVFDMGYLGRLVLPFAGDASSVGAAAVLLLSIVGMETVHVMQEVGARQARPAMLSTVSRWLALGGLTTVILTLGVFDAASFIYFQF